MTGCQHKGREYASPGLRSPWAWTKNLVVKPSVAGLPLAQTELTDFSCLEFFVLSNRMCQSKDFASLSFTTEYVPCTSVWGVPFSNVKYSSRRGACTAVIEATQDATTLLLRLCCGTRQWTLRCVCTRNRSHRRACSPEMEVFQNSLKGDK